MKVNGLHNTEDIPELWIDAIQYAVDNGADIISMSIGIEYYRADLEDAVNYAHGNGVFLTASAGNQGWSNEHYPAAYDNVTGVAATNDEDGRMEDAGQWSASSNYGPWVHVAAPGEDIFSTMPTYHVTLSDYGISSFYAGELCGTSCSAPNVAGLAGLLLSRNPALSPDELTAMICENADPYNSTYDLGSGRINAYSALSACVTSTPTMSPASPTSSHTPPPTTTPSPPTETPTGCDATGVRIIMPSEYYMPGSPCYCDAIVCNADGALLTGYPLFVALDVYGTYFFAPSFSDFDFIFRDFPAGQTTVTIVQYFTWPSGTGSARGITWYGAMTNPEMTAVYGELNTFSFGWGASF